MNAILRKFSVPSTSSRSISKIFCWRTLCFIIEILFFLAIALYSVIQNAGAAAAQIERHRIIRSTLDEPGLNLTAFGSLGGPVLDVVVQGSYAFASFGPSLKVIDISNPDELTEVAILALQDNVIDMAFSPPYLVLAPAHGGLSMIDITDPLNPQQTGFINQHWNASALDIAGSDAYITTFYSGLQIINISDPKQLSLQGGYYPETDLLDIEIAGGYAYIAQRWPRIGIGIFDISNPTVPVEVGFYPADFYYSASMTIAGEYLYLSGDNIGLQILDISIPAAPQLIGSHPLPMIFPVDVTLAGEYVYLAWRDATYSYCIDLCQGGLQVMDVSNPQNPGELGLMISPGSANSLTLAGNRILLTRQKEMYDINNYGGELQLIDIANPASPTLIAAMESPLNRPEDILVLDNTAYIVENYAALENSALRLVDVTFPSDLALLGSFEVPGEITDVAVASDHAYLVEVPHPGPGGLPVGGGFRILDTSSPQTPVEIGYFNNSSWQFWSMDVEGSYAYLLAQDTCPNGYDCMIRLWILDISNPANPTEVGIYEFGGFNIEPSCDVLVQDGYAYLALRHNGLQILDITNPAHPSLVGSLLSDDALDVDMSGDYAYLGDSLSGVSIVSLQDRAHPVEIARVSAWVQDLTVSDAKLYIATIGLESLRVFDISLPETPVELAYFPGLGFQSHVAAGNGVVYLTIDSVGLFLLELAGSIQGTVLQPNRMPAAEVTISANGTYTTTTSPAGTYSLVDLEAGSYTVTPFYPGYTFSPLQREVSVPPNAAANFTLLPMPVSADLSPGITSTLTYTDIQGLPTGLRFPPGAVLSDTQVVLTPTIKMDLAGNAFTGHAFELAATQQGALIPELSFSASVSVTIQYSAADTALISDPAGLALWWWDGTAWQDAAASCPVPENNLKAGADGSFQGSICKTGVFALYGPTHPIFIPEIIKP